MPHVNLWGCEEWWHSCVEHARRLLSRGCGYGSRYTTPWYRKDWSSFYIYIYMTLFHIIWQCILVSELGTSWNHTQSQLLGSCRLIVLLLRLHQISVCGAQSSTTASTGPMENVPIFFYLPHGRQIARRQSWSSRAVNGLSCSVSYVSTYSGQGFKRTAGASDMWHVSMTALFGTFGMIVAASENSPCVEVGVGTMPWSATGNQSDSVN